MSNNAGIPLLLGVWLDDERIFYGLRHIGNFWGHNLDVDTDCSAFVWDVPHRAQAEAFAIEVGGVVKPLLTLENVIQADPKKFMLLAKVLGGFVK